MARKRQSLPRREEYYVATMRSIRDRGGAAPISQIEQDVLRSLNISKAAALIPHGDGKQRQYQYDLAWVRTYLKWGGAIINSQPAIWSVTKAGQQMTDEQIRSLWRTVIAEQRAKRKRVPKLPQQGPGPHFVLDDGVLSFAPSVDGQGNDLARLNALHPLMRDTVDQLIGVVEKNKGLWPVLETAIRGYAEVISCEVNSIDFGRLFGQGLLLSGAIAAAKRQESSGNVFALPANETVLAEGLMGMHAVFLMGSRDGQALVSDAHRFEATGAETRALKESELELSRALSSPEAPVASSVKEHINEIISVGADTRADHHQSYIGGLVRNAAIVTVGASLLLTFSSASIPGVSLGVFGSYLAILFGSEGLKKSRIGKDAAEFIASAIDATTIDFVTNNEKTLRSISQSGQMQWLDKALDLLKQGQPDTAVDESRIEPTFESDEPTDSIEQELIRLALALRVCGIEFGIDSSKDNIIETIQALKNARGFPDSLARNIEFAFDVGPEAVGLTKGDVSVQVKILKDLREEVVSIYQRIA